MEYRIEVGLDCPATETGYLQVREMFEAVDDIEAIRVAKRILPGMTRGWPVETQCLYQQERLVRNLSPVTLMDVVLTAHWGFKASWKLFWRSGLGFAGPIGALTVVLCLAIINGKLMPLHQALTLITFGFVFTAALSVAPIIIAFVFLAQGRRLI